MCREVWSSGPSAAALAARAAWKQLTLSEALTWTQSSSDIEIRLLLPAGGTQAQVLYNDSSVTVPDTVNLNEHSMAPNPGTDAGRARIARI